MESHVVTGIAFSRDEAQLTLRRVADHPGVAAAIFMSLAEANINVDMIVQVASEESGVTDLTFTVSAADFERRKRSVPGAETHRFYKLHGASDVVKVSAMVSACAVMRASRRGIKALAKSHPYPGDHDVGEMNFRF